MFEIRHKHPIAAQIFPSSIAYHNFVTMHAMRDITPKNIQLQTCMHIKYPNIPLNRSVDQLTWITGFENSANQKYFIFIKLIMKNFKHLSNRVALLAVIF